MKTFISTLLLISTLSLSAQWHFQNPLHSGYYRGLIKFDDINNGRIIYNNGDYLSTTNGGNNWDINYCNPKVEIEGKFFINNDLGWGHRYSTIWKTVEGGYTWTQLPCKNKEFFPESIRSIYFINENLGFLLEGESNIWRSTDGGLAWEKILTSGAQLNLIKFRNEYVGYTVGSYGVIMKTIDGGENWTTLYTPGWEDCANISFFGNDTIYVQAGSHSIMKSYNDGANWFEHETSINGFVLTMNFLDKNLGYAFGKDGLIFKTNDGGYTWEDQSVELDNDCSLGRSYFFDNDHGFVVGTNGYLFKTNNGGQNWVDLSYGSRATMLDISFINETKGCAVGTTGYINETENGGRNWISKKLPVNERLYSISFINNLEYMICGNNGTLFSTSNGGINWDLISTSITSRISDVYFTSLENGLLLCSDGKIYKTTNQCETVTLIRDEEDDYYTKMNFTDSQNGFIVGRSNSTPQTGLILKTTDGGENWTQVLESERTLTDIDFISNLYGWAVGSFGQVFRTNDAGITWDSLNIGKNTMLTGVSFANNDKGWATGGYGKYYETSDGGITWSIGPNLTSTELTAVCSINDTTVWLSGCYGEIINHGVAQSTGINEPPIIVASNIALNYPNPFDNKTYVDIEIVNKGNINIYIYDISGQLVYFGHDYSTQSGKHTVMINGNSLNSGIYIVEIITNEKKFIQKIIKK